MSSSRLPFPTGLDAPVDSVAGGPPVNTVMPSAEPEGSRRGAGPAGDFDSGGAMTVGKTILRSPLIAVMDRLAAGETVMSWDIHHGTLAALKRRGYVCAFDCVVRRR